MYPPQKRNFYVSFPTVLFCIVCLISGFILGQRWTENSEMYLVHGSYQYQLAECEAETRVPCEVIIYGVPKAPLKPKRNPNRSSGF